MLIKWIQALKNPTPPSHLLAEEYIRYAQFSYPSNHTYKISKQKLIPQPKLRKRYKKICPFFPKPLTSLVDIGCSKGFFVFSASVQPLCSRSLGIDISDYDIQFCNQIKTYLNTERVRFELLKLDELAKRINEFGGPFQTVLLFNIYQYLFFGSDRFAGHYLDHTVIFKQLREICSQRIIFSNRVNLNDCQNDTWIKNAGIKSQDYSVENIISAASKYFTVTPRTFLGRYPLWTMDVI